MGEQSALAHEDIGIYCKIHEIFNMQISYQIGLNTCSTLVIIIIILLFMGNGLKGKHMQMRIFIVLSIMSMTDS